MHLNGETLDFLARFSKSPDGQFLLKWLEARLDDRDTKLRIANGEEVHRQQGRALELVELIDDIVSAHSKLNRPAPIRTSGFRQAP